MKKPNQLDWFDIQASSLESAVQNYHEYNFYSGSYFFDQIDADGKITKIHFILVEILGFGELVSRIYYRGIYRRGGVKPYFKSIESIAMDLGWEHAPNELLNSGWEGEEQ